MPAEFRLPEPEFTKEQLELLEELIQLITPNLSRGGGFAADERARMAGFLVDLGTGVWRIRRKIDGLSRMPREIRDALYSLESMWMSMSEGGVEIIDHIGAVPSPKEALIVETRDVPGLTREQVIDAVKPTILFHGEVVQRGEVIMGRPAAPGAFLTTYPQPGQDDGEEGEATAAGEAETAPQTPDETFAPSAHDAAEDEPTGPDAEPEYIDAAEPADDEADAAERAEAAADFEPEPEPAEPGQYAETIPIPEAELDAAAQAQPDEEPEASEERHEEELPPEEPQSPELGESPSVAGGETEDAPVEIPLPKKAPRRGRTVREAVKQVILDSPDGSAFDGTGRAKRRKARASADAGEKPEEQAAETKPRRKRASKKTDEGEA
jgi:hypothetical protein